MRPSRAACAAALLLSSACSPATMGMNRMANALSETAGAYARDDDPDFVRLAAPSTLKMVEMLLEDQPAHTALLMTACSGFTQYAYAFLQVESEMQAPRDPGAAAELKDRAARMYRRARGYCVRALETRHAGASAKLLRDTAAVMAVTAPPDVPALFWTAVSWAGDLALADDQLRRLEELAAVRIMLTRAIELDEAWSLGAIHEAFIVLDGLPALAGGSRARARAHFERAVALSEGQSAFAYVTMAASVAVPEKNRGEFERLLASALAIDVQRTPSLKLANLIAQRRARFLLSRVDALF